MARDDGFDLGGRGMTQRERQHANISGVAFEGIVEGIEGISFEGDDGEMHHGVKALREIGRRARKNKHQHDKHDDEEKALHAELKALREKVAGLEKALPKLPPGVHESQLGPKRRYIAPISGAAGVQPTGPLAAGSSYTLTINIQRAFQMERLVLATDEANSASSQVTVDNFLVGAIPQFALTGSAPLAMFAPTAVFTALLGDTAIPGTVVTLAFTNNNASATVRIWGAFVGESLQLN